MAGRKDRAATLVEASLLLAVLFLAGWALGWTRATAVDRYGDLDLFVDVFAKVHQFYVDPIDADALRPRPSSSARSGSRGACSAAPCSDGQSAWPDSV